MEKKIPFDFFKKYLGGDLLIFKIEVSHNGISFLAKVLVDIRANGYVFINIEFVKKARKLLKLRKIVDFKS